MKTLGSPLFAKSNSGPLLTGTVTHNGERFTVECRLFREETEGQVVELIEALGKNGFIIQRQFGGTYITVSRQS